MKKLKRIFLPIVAIILWTVFVAAGFINGFLLRPITSETSSEEFIKASKEEISAEFVGNLAMILIENGVPSESYFYGIDNETITENTVFQVASISKWVTSWGIFKLIEDDKLALDTPIEHYLTRWHLPESEFDHDEVTVRSLLSHTSGLVDGLGYDGFYSQEKVQTIEASLTRAADAPYSEGIAKIGNEPNTQYQYSGAGYTILQLLIEEVSGQSFQQYMTENIFEPLQMNNSTFILSEKPSVQVATWYKDDGSVSKPVYFTALAAASLYTSASDLSKFVIANSAKNNVLSIETLEQMHAPEAFQHSYAVHAAGPAIYGGTEGNAPVIGHDGSSDRPVINTAARLIPETKDGIVVLEMGNHGMASRLADEWMFWKLEIADYVVMQRNKSYLITLLIIGYLVIIFGAVVIIRRAKA
ncbi:serine hydrolase domain-containing protein [Cochleicola gelatinilyticus]|uniref:Serine hydrolase n=1 Tax=Cochleicola gelatinilyticus TaxID=1763537 RepID=A0A167HG27_9FLAO|nr:serine hydrolase [Cochleicola gelatinilyticus]OAB78571.1 serine hydrolase [Cochleicola gelatinilyticus]